MNKRGSGVLLHITSLPSAHGIGDLGPAAYNFADLLESAGQSYWQILPLNPTNPSSGNSPYFSSSAFAGNPLLISLERLLDQGLLAPEDIQDLPAMDPAYVDHDAVSCFKMKTLDKAFKTFKGNGPDSGFAGFCSENSNWLDDFALFMSLREKFNGQAWNRWPNDIRDRESGALTENTQELKERIDKEKFLQYMFFRQWTSLKSYCNEKGIKIIGDIPIYVSYDSADVWVNAPIFKLDEEKNPYVVSGVPPDYFSETGQLWNNPVYRWDVLKETRYDWWRHRLAHTFELYDMVRIDHFRGLVQYWEIPAGEETAVNGKWEDVPTYDFFDTLRNELPDFPVIVEDLGLITPDVKEAIEHFEFPGMKVLQFAFGADNPDNPYLPHNYPKNCVAYTGTHDNNTLMGWFGKEISSKEKSRLLHYLYRKKTPAELNWELIRLVLMSVADTAIIPAQDILGLGDEARMNQPREVEGNWKWRLLEGQLSKSHAERLLGLTRIYGRCRK